MLSTMTRPDWLPLGAVPPEQLAAARLELHWALQLPAALGIARAASAPDFGQHALVFEPRLRALVGARVEHPRPYRAALRLDEPTLLLLTGQNAQPEEVTGALSERAEHALRLEGHTLAQGFEWLRATSARYTGVEGPPLGLPEHELPDHPLAHGARFGQAAPAHRHELARWFANLAGLLGAQRAGRAASPLRVWSHHFDLDTVLDLGPGSEPGTRRTLGLGFSPGDDSFAEPCLYALPTPAPDAHALGALAAPFEWIREGWIGAVLRGSRLVERAGPAQSELAAHFLRAAEERLASTAEQRPRG